MTELFDDWTNKRLVASLSTNGGAQPLAFQSWHHFKEAFSPELIRRAVEASPIRVNACFDPFGGSGTTALAAQFLGIGSTTIEVNPFLADVIRARLMHYDADALTATFVAVQRRSRRLPKDPDEVFACTPKTFIEPGVDGRWLFNRDIAARVAAILSAIDGVTVPDHRRFLRAVLGGLLVDVSNVVISGKGRRYRRNWQHRGFGAEVVDRLFAQRIGRAISEVHRFADRPRVRVDVRNGDARRITPRRTHELVVFSPPYPNSFDYTDVYNVELWMLGYLTTGADNKELRQATLTSHVQMRRLFAAPPSASAALNTTLRRMAAVKGNLWSPWIPGMVGAYFADLARVIGRARATLAPGGLCWMVVGDSRYGGVHIPTAKIVAELAPSLGWSVHSRRAFRSMRSSAQQGGRNELSETLVILSKAKTGTRRKRKEPKQ